MVNINLIGHTQVKLYHLKPQTLKHVEIIKFWSKPTYDISLERSWLGDHRFWILPWVNGAGNNISKRLTGKKPVKNEVTSERGYCLIISVGRSEARSNWFYPQYPILLTWFFNIIKGASNFWSHSRKSVKLSKSFVVHCFRLHQHTIVQMGVKCLRAFYRTWNKMKSWDNQNTGV